MRWITVLFFKVADSSDNSALKIDIAPSGLMGIGFFLPQTSPMAENDIALPGLMTSVFI
jgi:hypothetical protein